MGALAISDLRVLSGEPRVADIRLGEVLGFGHARGVRKLIRRHKAELLRHGEVCATLAQTLKSLDNLPNLGGRPAEAYSLNEAQALVICMHAQTKQAVEVRSQIIAVFLAWRRGQLPDAAPKAGPATADRWDALNTRLAAIERTMRHTDARDTEQFARSLAFLPPSWPKGDPATRRRQKPRFWGDLEVRGAVISLYRQMTIDQAVGVLNRQFGMERAPSRSSLGRFWRWLDGVQEAA